MKKFSHLLLVALLSSFIVACDDDSAPFVDTEDPTAVFTSPTAAELADGFEPGTSFVVAGTVTDNRDLESVTLTATAPNGTDVWFTETWTEANATFTDQTLTLNKTIDIPATAAEGIHVLTLTALDDAGNELVQTLNLKVLPATQTATFRVTIPAAVTENLFISGELMNPDGTAATWVEPGVNPAFMLTKVDDLTYTITVPIMDTNETPGVLEFKFFRGAGWNNGEIILADCTGPNRTLTLPAPREPVALTVEGWRVQAGCP